MSRKCPCHGCKDRNGICHTEKGNCPHDFEGWRKEHEKEREERNKKKALDVPRYTKAQETRHFNYIKGGQGNTKR